MLKHRTSPTQLKIDVWKGCRPHTIGHRFSASNITKICKASLAAELITYDSLTKMTQPHNWTPQLFQPKKRRSNAFKYSGRALLSVQFTTSLTSFSELIKADHHKPHKLSELTKPDRHKPHKLKDCLLNSEFQKINNQLKISNSIFELILLNSAKIQIFPNSKFR